VPDYGASGGSAARLATAYTYAAPDQSAAESMADAMAAFGYAEVGARPTQRRYLLENGMGWELVVVDDNPYPPGRIGLLQELAVERQARAIARAHRDARPSRPRRRGRAIASRVALRRFQCART
jgi:hypothetical protein